MATRNWYHISLIWLLFPIDLISGGAKNRLQPLYTIKVKLLQSPYFCARRVLHRPYPWVFCTLPSFARIKRPIKVAARRTQRSTSTISRKIGDCEQSTYDPKTKSSFFVPEIFKFFYYATLSPMTSLVVQVQWWHTKLISPPRDETWQRFYTLRNIPDGISFWCCYGNMFGSSLLPLQN